eukprot:477644_1
MGNIKSTYANRLHNNISNSSVDSIQQLETICDTILRPSKQHFLRVLIGPTTLLTSTNPHILLKIANWHKLQTDCIVFDFHMKRSKNNCDEFIFKMSLTNKHIQNNNIWKSKIIDYMNKSTSYVLTCVTSSMNPNKNGNMYFISWCSRS